MANTDPRTALQTLLKLRSPANQTPTGDAYTDTHRNNIMMGEDPNMPSDAELTAMQNTEGVGTFGTPEREVRTSSTPWSLGGGGSAVRGTSVVGGNSTSLSRDQLREAVVSQIRQKLGLIGAQSQADIAKASAPEIIKGKYGVEEANIKERAARADAATSAAEIDARQRERIAADDRRQTVGFAHADTAREDTQAFKGGQISPGALSAIDRDRQQLVMAQQKAEPNALSRMVLRRTNPVTTQLESFDNALGLAKKIAAQHPDLDAATGAAALGEDQLTPDELGQTQKFLLMLRGH